MRKQEGGAAFILLRENKLGSKSCREVSRMRFQILFFFFYFVYLEDLGFCLVGCCGFPFVCFVLFFCLFVFEDGVHTL